MKRKHQTFLLLGVGGALAAGLYLALRKKDGATDPIPAGPPGPPPAGVPAPAPPAGDGGGNLEPPLSSILKNRPKPISHDRAVGTSRPNKIPAPNPYGVDAPIYTQMPAPGGAPFIPPPNMQGDCPPGYVRVPWYDARATGYPIRDDAKGFKYACVPVAQQNHF